MPNTHRTIEDDIIYVDTREELDAMLFRSPRKTVVLRGTDPDFVKNFVLVALDEIERLDAEN